MKALLESQMQSASEERTPEDDVIRSQFLRGRLIRSKYFPEANSSEAKILQTLESVDKVQCTKSTTTMPTPVPATTNSAQYPLYTTRITTTNAETFPYLVEWI